MTEIKEKIVDVINKAQLNCAQKTMRGEKNDGYELEVAKALIESGCLNVRIPAETLPPEKKNIEGNIAGVSIDVVIFMKNGHYIIGNFDFTHNCWESDLGIIAPEMVESYQYLAE